MSASDNLAELNKLRWRCRRGTLELDLMLLRYLEQRYQVADDSDQQRFLGLLAMEDSELIRYLLGERICPDVALQALISEIRALPC